MPYADLDEGPWVVDVVSLDRAVSVVGPVLLAFPGFGQGQSRVSTCSFPHHEQRDAAFESVVPSLPASPAALLPYECCLKGVSCSVRFGLCPGFALGFLWQLCLYFFDLSTWTCCMSSSGDVTSFRRMCSRNPGFML